VHVTLDTRGVAQVRTRREQTKAEWARPARGRRGAGLRGGGVFLVLRRGCRPVLGSQQSVPAMVRAMLTFSKDASCIPSGLSRLRFSCAPNLIPAKHSGIRAMPADGMAGRRWTQRVSRPPIFRSSPSVFASIRLKLPGPGRPSAPDPPPKSGALPHARLALPARRARCALGLRIYPLPSTLLDVHGRLRRSLGRWDRDLGLLFATSPMHESQPKLALPTHQSGVIPTSANFPGFSRAKVAPSPLAT